MLYSLLWLINTLGKVTSTVVQTDRYLHVKIVCVKIFSSSRAVDHGL